MYPSLLADIGGTNTRVALAENFQVKGETIMRYSNARYKACGKDISHILQDYLTKMETKVSSICVASAGFVRNNQVMMTNLDWHISLNTLAHAINATDMKNIALLNDLQAQGFALEHISHDKLTPIIRGPHVENSTMLVVGLGTGVNTATVHALGTKNSDGIEQKIVTSSESGHISMPIRSQNDLEIMHFIEALLVHQGEIGHCSIEEVLSGRGLANLYAFALYEKIRSELGEEQALRDAFVQRAELSSAKVLELFNEGDKNAMRAAQLYVYFLAESLADLALVHLPYSGIYLIGGMARAAAPCMKRFNLKKKFRQNRRVDLLNKDFSVTIVEDDYAALSGCAAYLQMHQNS